MTEKNKHTPSTQKPTTMSKNGVEMFNLRWKKVSLSLSRRHINWNIAQQTFSLSKLTNGYIQMYYVDFVHQFSSSFVFLPRIATDLNGWPYHTFKEPTMFHHSSHFHFILFYSILFFIWQFVTSCTSFSTRFMCRFFVVVAAVAHCFVCWHLLFH